MLGLYQKFLNDIITQMTDFPKIFKPKLLEQNDITRESLKDKYYTFRRLLTTNNQVLGLIADMEEKLSGEYLFDTHYINKNVRLIADEVLNIIENLNSLSKNKYAQLYKIHDDINNEIEKILGNKFESTLKKKEPLKDTHLLETMEKILDWIVPLNLIDPEDENFKPEYCKTFYDITRFAHEIAMQEMFYISEGRDIKELKTVSLIAGIPLDACLLDVEGGLKENIKKAAPEDILSIPFSAFLKGLKSMKWPEPRPVDVRGFLGIVAHTVSVPEEQLYQMGEKSFSIVSRNYMNFSIKLGYHFSMVEAYAGENINDNYIKFFFKGGGAAYDRRLRRVRLITEILKKMEFRINVKEDVINAILTKYKQTTIEEKLEILGRLTVYTKQLDMVLFNDAVTDMYIEQFIKEHIK